MENGVSYKIKRVGSSEKEVKVHVDDMNSFKRWDPRDLPHHDQAVPNQVSGDTSDANESGDDGAQARMTGKKYQVQEIMDEKGKGTSKHEYLVKWDGTKEDGSEWKCTWIPEGDLDSHLLVMNWEMAGPQERGRRRKQAADWGVQRVNAQPRMPVAAVMEGAVRPVQANVLEMVRRMGSHGSIVQQVCTELGIEMSEVAFVWASPPCETYTKLDWTNVTRGNEFRDPKDRGPRSVETCHSEADFKKRQKAMDDDCLLTGLVESLESDNRMSRSYQFAVENPQGMLAEQVFMQTPDWMKATRRELVHYCNYGGQFHKPTHVWSSIMDWVPGGRSGCGQCCQDCKVGRWKWVEERVRKAGMQYVHDHQIGGQSDKKGVGEGSQKLQRWKVPASLLEEILRSVKKANKGDEKKKYVIDFFAGQGSLRKVSSENGYVYVPVDVDMSHLKM